MPRALIAIVRRANKSNKGGRWLRRVDFESRKFTACKRNKASNDGGRSEPIREFMTERIRDVVKMVGKNGEQR